MGVEITLKERVNCAIFICCYGAENTGVATQRTLMHPYTEYEPDDVKRSAARLLARVHTGLLALLPPDEIQLILKDINSYLSFAVGDGWPDDNNQSPRDK